MYIRLVIRRCSHFVENSARDGLDEEHHTGHQRQLQLALGVILRCRPENGVRRSNWCQMDMFLCNQSAQLATSYYTCTL